MKKTGEKDKEKLVDFKKMGAIMEKNFLVLSRDRARMIPLLIMPIIMILIFGYISGNTPKHLPTAVVVYDNSPISEQVLQAIEGSDVFAVKYLVSNEGEGRKLLDQSKIRVLIEIPPDLQHNVENNIQNSIIVIVDESDSSVGMTAKSTMNVIINSLSYQLSLQKIAYFQGSVQKSALELRNLYSSQVNQYYLISTYTQNARSALEESRKITDSMANVLSDSLITLPPVVIASGNNKTMTYNNTYYLSSPSENPMMGQINLLKSSSSIVSASISNLQSVEEISKNADSIMQINNDYSQYQKNVVEPISDISVFTTADPNGILRPLVYAEKPAYGTGKRAIDFLIPSIIALTIFQGAVMGMGRSVAGEKREGSLTRVFLTPTSNATIITGTVFFYMLFELCRSIFILLVAMAFFNIQVEGNMLLIGLILLLYAGTATAIGMALSSAVKTEQQFMAMAMLVSMPTIFLSGAFFPLQAMPKFMQILANFIPVTYGADALRGVMIKGFPFAMVTYPIMIMLLFFTVTMSIVFMVWRRDIE